MPPPHRWMRAFPGMQPCAASCGCRWTPAGVAHDAPRHGPSDGPTTVLAPAPAPGGPPAPPSNTILPGRAGGTVDAAVSKTVGATPREGSNPSPGTLLRKGFRLVSAAEPGLGSMATTATELLEDPESGRTRGSAVLEVLDTCKEQEGHAGRHGQVRSASLGSALERMCSDRVRLSGAPAWDGRDRPRSRLRDHGGGVRPTDRRQPRKDEEGRSQAYERPRGCHQQPRRRCRLDLP
jgi:hypothetical protein